MRIKFIEHDSIKASDIGNEYQISDLKPKGHTIVAGYRVAANGILKPFVENITVYKLIKNDEGEEVKVEVIPEVVLEDV